MRGYFGIGIALITFISNLNAFEKRNTLKKRTLQKWWEIVALARRILLGAEPCAESFPMAARIFLCKLGIRGQTAAGGLLQKLRENYGKTVRIQWLIIMSPMFPSTYFYTVPPK
jgi:hypothetical protein